ncbi:IclR family transcriptional regulator C-terminal domain-containing protein [Sebaldella sp. S0638]|uniref:IclR family transcriptional regulator n=1 Tax=Sebaldella sp. S0638 TaxID=2957809 RepID=UPI0020A09299|nr:IclR family transcriptional regulator [Sebaldella sp. S0638]
MEETKGTLANQSAEKVLSIIEYIAKQPEACRLQDIAKDLKMSPSTVLRFLNSLLNSGYIEQDKDTSKYDLTYKICGVSNLVASKKSMRKIALPFMRNLSKMLGESVCLAIEQSSYIVYVEVVEGIDQIVKTMQRIGNSSPMHCTGVGKLFLSQYDDSQVVNFVEKMGLPKFTENTITTLYDLQKELVLVSQQGYAIDNEECEIGAKCVAVPITDYTSKIIATISITGPIFRMSDEKISEILPLIINTAKEISNKLGYNEKKS